MNSELKPKIRFKGFIDDWEQRKLNQFSKYITSNKTASDIVSDGLYDLYDANNIIGKINNDVIKEEYITIIKDGSGVGKVRRLPKNTLFIGTMGGIIAQNSNIDFIYCNLIKTDFTKEINGATIPHVYYSSYGNNEYYVPSLDEQKKIGMIFNNIDNLITLHQRYKNRRKGVDKMDTYDGNELFYKYYERWVNVYKEGAIRKSTMQKYNLSLKWLKKLAPKLKLKEVNRITYQEILNGYAEKHERQSTMDFHHQIKASVLDAVDDGYIEKDPTRKAIIKGRTPVREKKEKYLNQFELQKLISDLNLKNSINSDWLIYLIAKTGLRFSEALAITPKDFDFPHQILNVDKTWNYKDNTGFEATKNKSSERKVQLDWQTVIQFSELVKDLEPSSPIFINDRIYNSTINDLLARHCKRVEIPVISIHGLRHTHASLLLYAGVSVASVAHRLGHASMTTTQKIYLHIIQELENTDIDKIMRALTSLNS